jgi:predicted secreted Zn-dependent protease
MMAGLRLRSVSVGTACILLSVVICLPQAVAEPEVLVQKVEYWVSGRTAALIRQNLDRNTPVRQNGKPFDAYTQWDVDWQLWWTFDADGTCRMTEVGTTVRIRQTFPRLDNADDLPAQLSGRWEGYMRALIEHEEGHVMLGVDAAREIERQLSQMGDRSSCDQLESEANALARDIIARHALLEVQYDADTNYGERDGARFP